MNEIIRKIDELLEELPRCCNANYMKDGCVYKMKELTNEVKEIIQAEQKDVTNTNVGKIKTNGDLIRESNESLAEFITKQFGDERIFIRGDVVDIEDYLNQPVVSEINIYRR